MGLFDWLTDAGGSSLIGGGTPTQPGPGSMTGEMNPMGDPTGQSIPLPTPSPGMTRPMPPVQQTGPDAYPMGGDPMAGMAPPPTDPMIAGGAPDNGPGLPFAPGSDPMTAGGVPFSPGTDPMTAGGAPPNGPGLQAPPMPPPLPRPATPAIPPNAAPTAGAGVPAPPVSLAPPGNGTNGVGPGLGVATPADLQGSPLARALGLNPNKAKEAVSGFGAALTAAGNSRGKSKMAAFASGAGAGIEGGDKRGDKITEEQSKYLTQAIAAAKSGDERALNQARTQLALAQAKQTGEGKANKDSVVNSEQQLYLRAQSAAAQDGRLKALKTQSDQASSQFGADSAQAKAAAKAHKDAYDATVEGHLRSLGLDPNKAKTIGKQPGMSEDNPIKVKSNDDLAKAQPGMIVQLPNGQIMRKKMDAAPAPAAGTAPAAPSPAPVTAPAGSKAAHEDDSQAAKDRADDDEED